MRNMIKLFLNGFSSFIADAVYATWRVGILVITLSLAAIPVMFIPAFIGEKVYSETNSSWLGVMVAFVCAVIGLILVLGVQNGFNCCKRGKNG